VKVVIKMSGVIDKKYKLITREAQYDSDKNGMVHGQCQCQHNTGGTNYSYGIYDNKAVGYMFQYFSNSSFQIGYGAFTGNSSGVNAASFNVGTNFTANSNSRLAAFLAFSSTVFKFFSWAANA
jgi:hypothetical protein